MILTPSIQPKQIELNTVPSRLIPQVIRLHRAVFSPAQVACTIYGCKGAARYFASLAAYPQFQPEHVVWGAWKGRSLVGYAHYRALPDSWHLNNIAVHPGCQGQGIGRQLWDRFIATARERQFQQISLDVEHDNQLAVEWYQRHGLVITGTVWRYEKRISQGNLPPEALPPLRLLGWEQAEAWQLAYGFSQFQIHCGEEVWQIGRLGEHYFRVTQPLPDAIEAALAQIDPDRKLLLFTPEPLESPDFVELGKSLRMQGTLP